MNRNRAISNLQDNAEIVKPLIRKESGVIYPRILNLNIRWGFKPKVLNALPLAKELPCLVIGGWVNLGARLDSAAKRKNLCSCRKWN